MAEPLSPATATTRCNPARVATTRLFRSVIEHASEVTIVADHTKFSAPALYKIMSLEAVTRIVTDRMPSAHWAKELKSRGIGLVIPEE